MCIRDSIKGAIEPGKLADLVVLSNDPLTCPEDEIKDIVAETTIVGGHVVYERDVTPGICQLRILTRQFC